MGVMKWEGGVYICNVSRSNMNDNPLNHKHKHLVVLVTDGMSAKLMVTVQR